MKKKNIPQTHSLGEEINEHAHVSTRARQGKQKPEKKPTCLLHLDSPIGILGIVPLDRWSFIFDKETQETLDRSEIPPPLQEGQATLWIRNSNVKLK